MWKFIVHAKAAVGWMSRIWFLSGNEILS